MNRSKILRKGLGTLLIGALGIIVSAQSTAATLYGKVTDEKTAQPLQYAYVTTYKWNPDYKYWNYTGSQNTGSDGAFQITSLSAGTYYLVTQAQRYYKEYYNNVTSFANKTKFTLTATQSKSLGTIKLKPLPISISQVTLTPQTLPDAGGNVVLTAVILNNTGLSFTTKFWINLYAPAADGNQQNSTVVAPYSVTVPAGGLIINRTVTVPSSAPNGNYFYLTPGIGSSIWSPLLSSYWGGSLWKGATTQYNFTSTLGSTDKDSSDVVATSADLLDPTFTEESAAAPHGLGQPRIPEQIAEDGTVLKWRKAP